MQRLHTVWSVSRRRWGCGISLFLSLSRPALNKTAAKWSYLRTAICTRNKAFHLKLISRHKLLRTDLLQRRWRPATKSTTVNVVCARPTERRTALPTTCQQLIHIVSLFLRARHIPRYRVAILIRPTNTGNAYRHFIVIFKLANWMSLALVWVKVSKPEPLSNYFHPQLQGANRKSVLCVFNLVKQSFQVSRTLIN